MGRRPDLHLIRQAITVKDGGALGSLRPPREKTAVQQEDQVIGDILYVYRRAWRNQGHRDLTAAGIVPALGDEDTGFSSDAPHLREDSEAINDDVFRGRRADLAFVVVVWRAGTLQ